MKLTIPTDIIIAASIPSSGLRRKLNALEADAKAFAQLFDLQKIDSLTAQLELTQQKGDVFLVKGSIAAVVWPICVVTLTPFQQSLKIPVEMRFTAHPPEEEESDDLDLDITNIDDHAPDYMPDGTIDLWQVVRETISLTLDPYPRAPGAEFNYTDKVVDVSPFAALAKLKTQ